MEKFGKKLYGYDPNQVKTYLDNITSQVENMVAELKKKDEEIAKLKSHMMNNITVSEEKMKELKDKLDYYQNLESTLNRAIIIAQDTGDQIKENNARPRSCGRAFCCAGADEIPAGG